MGTLVAKIKSAPILMATISITFLGAVISFIITLVMAEWALGYLEMRVPFDVEIRNNYSHSFISEANISNGYEEISLKDNEFTTQWYSVVTDEEINSFLKDNSTLNIDDINLKISKNSTFKESIGEGIYGAYVDNIIILPDKVCDNLPFIETNFLANINNKMSYEEANEFQLY